MIKYYEHKIGDIIKIWACHRCCDHQGVKRAYTYPETFFYQCTCDICGHSGYGNNFNAELYGWLQLKIISYCED